MNEQRQQQQKHWMAARMNPAHLNACATLGRFWKKSTRMIFIGYENMIAKLWRKRRSNHVLMLLELVKLISKYWNLITEINRKCKWVDQQSQSIGEDVFRKENSNLIQLKASAFGTFNKSVRVRNGHWIGFPNFYSLCSRPEIWIFWFF